MSVVPSTVDTLADYAEELLAAAVLALATTSSGVPPRQGVVPAPPAIDCEQVTVHIDMLGNDSVSPSSPPTQVSHQFATGLLIITTLVVTVARCVPSVKTKAGTIQVPTGPQLTAASRKINQDAWAVFNTIVTMKDRGDLFNGRCRGMYVSPAVPIESAGGYAGWQIIVRPQIDGYDGAAPPL